MELVLLRAFIEVVKQHSINKAAKHLYVSQQALSRMILNLETEIAVPLFYRSSAGVELTEAGNYFLVHAQEILTSVDRLTSNLDSMRRKISGKLVVGFTYGTISALTPNLLLRFEEEHPEIELTYKEYPDLICDKMMKEGSLDISCTLGPIDINNFDAQLLISQPIYLAVNDKNPLSQLDTVSFFELSMQNFLLVTDEFRAPHNFREQMHGLGISSPNIVFQSNEIGLLLEMCSMNKGVALLNVNSTSHIPYDNIRTILVTDLQWEVYICSGKESPISRAGEVFRSYLLKNYKVYPDVRTYPACVSQKVL